MAVQKGKLVIIKIGDGGSPETFTTIGSFQNIRMVLSNKLIENTKVGQGAWRSLQGSAGENKLSVSGAGIFTDAAAEETLRQAAFANSANNFSLHFGNGDSLSGSFLVSNYERQSELGEVEAFQLSLESAGTITYNIAA